MKRLALPLVLGLLACCGCAHEYVMKLNNGMSITSASKPKLKGGTYVYKDALGHEHYMPQGRVLEIEPSTMAADENKFQGPVAPSKKHWYWPF